MLEIQGWWESHECGTESEVLLAIRYLDPDIEPERIQGRFRDLRSCHHLADGDCGRDVYLPLLWEHFDRMGFGEPPKLSPGRMDLNGDQLCSMPLLVRASRGSQKAPAQQWGA
jgi:hypothetical protein